LRVDGAKGRIAEDAAAIALYAIASALLLHPMLAGGIENFGVGAPESNDPLDALLSENDAYVEDHGFTARVNRAIDGEPLAANSPPAPTDVSLSAPLANAADNVTLRVYSFSTTAGALLVAGDYASVISITISPS